MQDAPLTGTRLGPYEIVSPLGSGGMDSRQDGPRGYDVTPDGKRFLMLVPEVIAAPPPAFHVLLNWTQRIAAR